MTETQGWIAILLGIITLATVIWTLGYRFGRLEKVVEGLKETLDKLADGMTSLSRAHNELKTDLAVTMNRVDRTEE